MYPYCDNNLIKDPITYEFSAYSGAEFLKSYEAARGRMIDYCQNKLSEIGMSMKPLVHGEEFINAIESCRLLQEQSDDENQILTNKFFPELLLKTINKDLNADDEQLIFVFIKKFEVSKRLWSAYDRCSYKKIGDAYDGISAYLLFANILACYIDFAPSPEKKTIAFNLLLKINDTISSVNEKLSSKGEVILALNAFEKEKSIYQSFVGEGGIR